MPGKKFRFALENVLKLRHHETEKARQFFQTAVAERERQEERLEEARQRLQSVLAAPPSNAAMDPAAYKRYDSFRRDAQRACVEGQRVLNQKHEKERAAMQQLVEHRRKEEALTNLKDQQKQEHQREVEAFDLAFMDETALSGYMRKASLL